LDARKVIDQFVNSLAKNDQEFADSLKRWAPLLVRTVERVSNITGVPFEDTFFDIIIYLCKLNKVYKMIQYRYEGKLYTLVEEKDGLVHLVPGSYLKRKRLDLWVKKEDAILVEKAALSSMVYQKIIQAANGIIRSHFSMKNGYIVVGKEKELVKCRGTCYDNKWKEIEKIKVKSVRKDVSFEDVEGSFSLWEPEKLYNEQVLYDDVKKNLSRVSARVFTMMMSHAKDDTITKKLSISPMKLAYCKREIFNITKIILGQEPMIKQSKYAIYKDNYYSVGKDFGERIELKLPNKSLIVDKSKVKIEVSKKKPIHLKVDEIC
jgi:hypothetical protein